MTSASLPAHFFQQYPQQHSYQYPPQLYQQPFIDNSAHYEPYYPSNPASPAVPPPDAVDSLNLRVLQRHVSSTKSLVFRAPYAVVYTFSSETATWEKIGKEGTLFVVQLSNDAANKPRERYAVVLLNRRGLENFILELGSGADEDEEDGLREDGQDGVVGGVQVEGEYIILQGTAFSAAAEATSPDVGKQEVYGLWVFEEEQGSTRGKREECAGVLRDCKTRSRQKKENQNQNKDMDANGGSYTLQQQVLTQDQDFYQPPHFFPHSSSSYDTTHAHQPRQHRQVPPPLPLQHQHQQPQTQVQPPGPTSPDLMALLNGRANGNGNRNPILPPRPVNNTLTPMPRTNPAATDLLALFRNAGAPTGR